MKTIIYSVAFVAACSVTGFAQNTPASSDTLIKRQERDTLIKREEINQKVEEVKQDVNQAVDRAKVKVKEEYQETRSYQERNQLAWFDKGSVMANAALGFGTGGNSRAYLSFSPRIGYFFQNGLVAGLRMSFDKRLGTSYYANQAGAFLRYYPFRTRISGFGGIGYSIGREYSSNIALEEKARYNSVSLEIGAMFRVLPRLGLELALENNYYDQTDALAGRNKGGRFRFGVNYFFGRANRF